MAINAIISKAGIEVEDVKIQKTGRATDDSGSAASSMRIGGGETVHVTICRYATPRH